MAKFVREYKCRSCGMIEKVDVPDYVQTREDALKYYQDEMNKNGTSFHCCNDGSLGVADFWGLKKVSD